MSGSFFSLCVKVISTISSYSFLRKSYLSTFHLKVFVVWNKPFGYVVKGSKHRFEKCCLGLFVLRDHVYGSCLFKKYKIFSFLIKRIFLIFFEFFFASKSEYRALSLHHPPLILKIIICIFYNFYYEVEVKGYKVKTRHKRLKFRYFVSDL